jgi:glutaredoxin
MNIVYIVIICLVILFLAYSFRPNYSHYEKEKAQEQTQVPIIYGAGFCGYCTKQKDELDAANVEYIYYDCTLPENKEKCSGIKSYPTIKFPNQTELLVGKQPIDKFAAYIKK